MDRRLLLPLMLVLGCAQGSLEGPGSFGLPSTATMTTTTQGDTDDDDGETEDDTDDGDGDGDGDTGSSTPSSTDPSTADDESSSAPITTAEDSSEDDSASLDDSASASGQESSSSDPSASATNSDDGAGMDDGAVPPPDAAGWENCEAAVCELGNDCITVNGVVGEAYCAPQCVTDLDCPYPDTGDATPFCLLVGEGAVDPTNCALVCEADGLDYGTCPDGMSCTSVPGQDPSISLCMW